MRLDRPMTKTTEVLLGLREGWSRAELEERIVANYRWVDRHRWHGWLAVGALFVVASRVAGTETVSGRGSAAVWLVWSLVAVGWLCARYTPLMAAPVAYVGILSHLPPPGPRNAREDATQRSGRFMLAVLAVGSLTMFGLTREYQLGYLDGIDTTDNPQLDDAVLEARRSTESWWWAGTMVVLGAAIVFGVSRWLHNVDRILYDDDICASGRRHRQPTGFQYFIAVAVVGGLLVALAAVVVTA